MSLTDESTKFLAVRSCVAFVSRNRGNHPDVKDTVIDTTVSLTSR